jgi:TolA-binding protein
MARKIFFAITVLVVLGLLARPVHAQTNPCGEDMEGQKIILPSGVEITGGQQEALIEVDGQQIPVQLSISCVPLSGSAAGESSQPTNAAETNPGPAATSAPEVAPSASTSTPGNSNNSLMIILAAVIPVVLIALGAGIYLKIIRPRQQKKPYLQALETLKAGRSGDAQKALTEVESKLTGKERRDARFFIAFTNFKQDNLDEALYVLNGLYKEDAKDYEAAYFLAYIYVQQKQYEKALPILENLERNKQLGLYQTKKLLGMVKLYQGVKAFNEGRIDVAVDLFETVCTLGDYADQIPADMSNRHTVLGTKALYENQVEEARHHFESLQNAAEKAAVEEQVNLRATAALGLAMVTWIDAARDYDEIEKQLCAAAQLLLPDEPLTRPWSPEMAQLSVEEKLTALDTPADQEISQDDREFVLRDIHFLRGINVLNQWSQLDGEAGLEQSETMLNRVVERFACAFAHDPGFGDVLLIVGLLYYYLYQPGSEKRNEGIRYLEEARKQGVRVPEVLEILNGIEKVRHANAPAVEKYLQILDKYLHDETVRKEVRLELVKRLSTYQRVRDYPVRRDLTEARQVEPTVAEVRDRSDMLRVRVEELLAARGTDLALENIRQLSDNLKEAGQELFNKAQAIQKTEADLLAVTGNQLLKE